MAWLRDRAMDHCATKHPWLICFGFKLEALLAPSENFQRRLGECASNSKFCNAITLNYSAWIPEYPKCPRHYRYRPSFQNISGWRSVLLAPISRADFVQ